MTMGNLKTCRDEQSSDYPKPKRIKEDYAPTEEMDIEDDNKLIARVPVVVSRIYPTLMTLTFCLEKIELWESNPLLLLKLETWTELYRSHKGLTRTDMAIQSNLDWSKTLYDVFTSDQFIPLAWQAFTRNGIPDEQIVDFMAVVHEMRAAGGLDDDFLKSRVFAIVEIGSSSSEYCEDSENEYDSETEIISRSESEATSVTKSLSEVYIEPNSPEKIREELKNNNKCSLVAIEQELQVEPAEFTTLSPARNGERYCRILTTNPQVPAPLWAFPEDSLSDDSTSESLEVPAEAAKYYTSCNSSDDSFQKPKAGPKRSAPRFLNGLGDISVLPPRRSALRDSQNVYLARGPPGAPAITPAMIEFVQKHCKRVTKKENPDVISKFTLKIKAKDLMAFRRGVWLQDVNLDFYLEMIQARNNAVGSTKAKVVIYHAFVHKMWENEKKFKMIEKHNDEVNIFERDLAFCPVHSDNHWRLLVADFDKKVISCYDSVPSNDNKGFLKNFRKIIEMERQKRYHDAASYMKSWKLLKEPEQEIPRQKNGNDCGIFTLVYANYLSLNKRFDFKQSEIPYFRQRMAYETATGTFLPDPA